MASIKAIAAIALTLMIAVPIGLGYMFATEDHTVDVWQPTQKVNLSETIYNAEAPIYSEFRGSSNNTYLDGYAMMNYVKVTDQETAYPIRTAVTQSISFTSDSFTALPDTYWVMTLPAGTTWVMGSDPSGTGNVTASGTVLTGTGNSIKMSPAATLTVTTYSFSDSSFADASYGWKVPSATSWLNQQITKSVTMLVDLPDDSTLYVGLGYRIINTDGVVTVKNFYDEQTLGEYPYVLLEISGAGLKASGVTAWPTMGSNYPTYNTVYIEASSPTPTVSKISLNPTDRANTIFRVESAEIYSGSFPWTKDYTLDMNNLFPDKSYSLTFNSIGIYGDSLTLGADTFTVTNGRISVGGQNVVLKGATISSRYNGAEYENYVNTHMIGTTASPLTLTFDGGWSLTVTANLVEQVQETRVDWNPGAFAFDKEDFAACGILVAGACLIGLGMYGARSGIKMGLLLLICGGAALIYLTFV